MRSLFNLSIIIIFCSISIIIVDNYRSNATAISVEGFVKPKPRITVYFGKKMPTCQSKFNICYMTLLVREYLPGDYEAIGTIETGEDDRSLIFTTKRITGFTNLTYSECFADGKFLMTEDFVIPENIVFELGYGGEPRIRSGNYPVIEHGELITIVFNR